ARPGDGYPFGAPDLTRCADGLDSESRNSHNSSRRDGRTGPRDIASTDTKSICHDEREATGMEVRPLEIATRRVRLADLVDLTKPRMSLLVLITTLVGFYMASTNGLRLVLLLHTIIGTALVAGGASALNQYVERELDALMVRTRNRPLPD